MHILITGGSGFIGSNLVRHPVFADSAFTVLTRSKAKCSGFDHARITLVEDLSEIPVAQQFDAVLNLAGAQIVGKRWSAARKQQIRESRIDLTKNLVEWMQTQRTPPPVLLSGSAIGYYGNTGDQEVDETLPAGSDFGAQLCVEWEAEARKAEAFGTRVCLLRTGLVFARNGGMLKQMILPFRFCLGSQIGNGKQWMSWIHLEDQIRIIRHLLTGTESTGPYNLVSPEPVTNRTFTKALAHSLGRFSLLAAPAFVIKLALGEAAALLLGGQKVLPKKLDLEGYAFDFARLESAFSEINGDQTAAKP